MQSSKTEDIKMYNPKDIPSITRCGPHESEMAERAYGEYVLFRDHADTSRNQAACIKSQKAQIETLLREVQALRFDNETLKQNNLSLSNELTRFNGGWK